MNSSIKKDYIWNTIGVLAQNAVSPLLLIIVTRQMGIDDSGLFSFAFSVSVVLWTVSMWGGRIYQVSDIKGQFAARHYLMVRLLLGVGVLLAAAWFAVSNGYSSEKTLLIVALTLLKVLESLADSLYGILQIKNRLYVTGISLLLKAAIGVIVFSVVLLRTSDLLTSTAALIGSTVLVLVLFDVPWIMHSGVPVGELMPKRRQWLREPLSIISKTSPIFMMSLLAILSINIPRYFIDKYHENQIGHFGIIAMPITLLTLLIMFIFQPNVVMLSRLYTKNKLKEFQRIISRVSLWIAAIGLGAVVATYFIGVPALGMVFNVDFSEYKQPLMIVVFGALINTFVGILMNTLVIMRHFKLQFFTLLITSTLLIPLCYMVVPRYGFYGAVVMYGAINLVQLIVLYIIYSSTLKQKRT